MWLAICLAGAGIASNRLFIYRYQSNPHIQFFVLPIDIIIQCRCRLSLSIIIICDTCAAASIHHRWHHCILCIISAIITNWWYWWNACSFFVSSANDKHKTVRQDNREKRGAVCVWDKNTYNGVMTRAGVTNFEFLNPAPEEGFCRIQTTELDGIPSGVGLQTEFRVIQKSTGTFRFSRTL